MRKLGIPSAATYAMAWLFPALLCLVCISPIKASHAAGPETVHEMGAPIVNPVANVSDPSFPITVTPTHGVMQGGNLVFIDIGELAADTSPLIVSCQFGASPLERGEFNPKI